MAEPIVRGRRRRKPGRIRLGGQIIRPVDPEIMSEIGRKVFTASKRAWICPNSECPCGSGKRFKRCCMRVK